MGFFMGLSAHCGVPDVRSFEDAEAVLAKLSKTPTGRERQSKQHGFALGGHSKSVTWVRGWETPNAGRSIAFRLYDTDVVTWNEDNSVDIDNFGTVTTSNFARRFLPGGVSLTHTVERRGCSGGHKGICFATNKRTIKTRWGEYAGHDYRLCWGGVVRLREVDGFWQPDEATLDTIVFPELDRKGARELARRYHLSDFAKWLSMAPFHMRIEHDGFDVDDCMEALEKRDFTLASTLLPVVAEQRGWGAQLKPLPIVMRRMGEHITMSSLAKLKLAMWDREGLLEPVKFTTISQGEFDRRMGRVRQLNQLDIDHNYGPPQW